MDSRQKPRGKNAPMGTAMEWPTTKRHPNKPRSRKAQINHNSKSINDGTTNEARRILDTPANSNANPINQRVPNRPQPAHVLPRVPDRVLQQETAQRRDNVPGKGSRTAQDRAGAPGNPVIMSFPNSNFSITLATHIMEKVKRTWNAWSSAEDKIIREWSPEKTEIITHQTIAK